MYALFFLMEVIAFWQLGNTRDAFLFQAMIFLITSCSGGGFSVMPAYLTDLFGTRIHTGQQRASSARCSSRGCAPRRAATPSRCSSSQDASC